MKDRPWPQQISNGYVVLLEETTGVPAKAVCCEPRSKEPCVVKNSECLLQEWGKLGNFATRHALPRIWVISIWRARRTDISFPALHSIKASKNCCTCQKIILSSWVQEGPSPTDLFDLTVSVAKQTATKYLIDYKQIKKQRYLDHSATISA